jgi:hypothetical protein
MKRILEVDHLLFVSFYLISEGWHSWYVYDSIDLTMISKRFLSFVLISKNWFSLFEISSLLLDFDYRYDFSLNKWIFLSLIVDMTKDWHFLFVISEKINVSSTIYIETNQHNEYLNQKYSIWDERKNREGKLYKIYILLFLTSFFDFFFSFSYAIEKVEVIDLIIYLLPSNFMSISIFSWFSTVRINVSFMCDAMDFSVFSSSNQFAKRISYSSFSSIQSLLTHHLICWFSSISINFAFMKIINSSLRWLFHIIIMYTSPHHPSR